MKLKALLIDMDGTLVKFKLDYLSARRRALEELRALGFQRLGFDENTSVYFMLKKLRGVVSEEQHSSLKKRLFDILSDAELKAADEAEVFLGAKEALRELKRMGLKLAVVTNNGRIGLKRTLERVGLDEGFFDAVVTRDDCDELKPDSGSTLKALRLLEVEADEAVMVGDGILDMEAAKMAGITSIAVPSGPYSLRSLLETCPDFIIDSISQLPMLVKLLMADG